MTASAALLHELALTGLRGDKVHHLVLTPPGYAYFRAEHPEHFNHPTYVGAGDTLGGIPYTLGAGKPDPYAWVRPFVIVTDRQMEEALELIERAKFKNRPAEERARGLLEDILCDLAENNNVTELEPEPGHTVIGDCHSVSRGIEIDGVRYMIVVATKEN